MRATHCNLFIFPLNLRLILWCCRSNLLDAAAAQLDTPAAGAGAASLLQLAASAAQPQGVHTLPEVSPMPTAAHAPAHPACPLQKAEHPRAPEFALHTWLVMQHTAVSVSPLERLCILLI